MRRLALVLVLACVSPAQATAWPVDMWEYWVTLAAVAVGSVIVTAILTWCVMRHTQPPPTKYSVELPREERVLPRALGWIQESKPDASEEVRLEPYVFEKVEKRPSPTKLSSEQVGLVESTRPSDSPSQESKRKEGGSGGLAVSAAAAAAEGGSGGKGAAPANGEPNSAETQSYFSDEELERWQLDRSAIKVISEIDHDDDRVLFKAHHATAGAHGLAKYATVVALSSIAVGPSNSEQAVCSFIEDCRLLMRTSHDNIVRLIGISLKPDAMRCAVEYAPYGQLLNVVRLLADHHVVLSELEQLTWAVQVAAGLSCLADKRIVHRNLSLRTCLLGAGGRVKIAGFKYSRLYSDAAVFEEHQHRGKLPLKHFAPEVLERGADGFSLASDVWAYGVLLAELMHGGKKPFREVPNTILLQRLESGLRFEKPPTAADELHEVMLAAMAFDAAQRPWASDLWRQLSDQHQTALAEAPAAPRSLLDMVRHFQAQPDDTTDPLAASLPPPDLASASLSAALAASLSASARSQALPSGSPVASQPSTTNTNSHTHPHLHVPVTPAPAMRRGTDASGPGSNGLSNSARKAIESVYERPIDSSPQPLPAGQSAASLNVPSNAAVSLNASMDEPDPDLIVPLRRGQAGAGAGAIGEEEGDEHGADEPLWLHFTPSKKVIQQRLAEQGLGDGLFLVRTSRRFSGEYMLALCHGGQAHNYRIRFAEGQFSLDKTRFFSTLPELVDFYRMDPDRVLPVPLLRACPRPDAESSVAYIPSASTPRTRLSATLTDFDLNAHAHA